MAEKILLEVHQLNLVVEKMPIKLKKNMVNQEFISRQDTYNMKIGGMGCRGLSPLKNTKQKLVLLKEAEYPAKNKKVRD